MRLARLLAAKVVTGLVMIWVVASATFFLVLDMPGNPAQAAEAQDVLHGMTPQQAERATAAIYGFVPKQSLAAQYGHYMGQLLHFNLGQSIAQEGTPVSHIVASAFPWTVILALSGILVSFLIGVCLGVLAAVKRSSKLGDALTLGGALINGIPIFVVALLLFYLFTTIWAIFPQGGNVSVVETPGWNAGYIGSVVSHAVLPVIA
ncbi:MAG: ABC transporter permease, partial [Trebonia sp.]